MFRENTLPSNRHGEILNPVREKQTLPAVILPFEAGARLMEPTE